MSHASGGYYVPHGSHWPIVGSVAFFLIMVGASSMLNGHDYGTPMLYTGIAVMLYMLFGWFGTVIRESERGVFNAQVDRSFRWGMAWFIFSEVCFFGAFFGALFYVRQFAIPWIGGDSNNFFTNLLLWNGYEAGWPTNGPANIGGDFEYMAPLGLPAWNTAILLSSGVTVTVAHHAMKAGNRMMLNIGLFLTFTLGFLFVALQSYEYVHAYTEMGLTLGSGIYGSTFFMLTGFHGMHVTLGVVMLVVIFLRCLSGHFTPEHHFAFEAVAWYWHFVDVVWLGLYIFVYWL